jgi:hypothetical protein
MTMMIRKEDNSDDQNEGGNDDDDDYDDDDDDDGYEGDDDDDDDNYDNDDKEEEEEDDHDNNQNKDNNDDNDDGIHPGTAKIKHAFLRCPCSAQFIQIRCVVSYGSLRLWLVNCGLNRLWPPVTVVSTEISGKRSMQIKIQCKRVVK